MEMKTSGTNQATSSTEEPTLTDFVTSADGTKIGYLQLGHGPGLVLVQGAMGSAQNFMQLARSLSDAFTVYIPDRRGRGLSPLPYSKDYRIQKDIEDLEALLAKTDARFVFGLSSGAVISLQAALILPAIRKIALFEPPLFTSGTPTAMLSRLQKEIAQDKLAAALITGMKAAQMGPPIFNVIPSFLLEVMVKMVMAQEEKKGSGEYLPMRALAPTLQYDFQIVVEMSGKLENFRALNAEVLLLGGSKSPAYLKADLDALEQVLPHVTRIAFPGLDHAASWNYDKQRNPGGKPEVVAQALHRYFAEP